jgi:Ca2+-binding EF-hand superfamily protein
MAFGRPQARQYEFAGEELRQDDKMSRMAAGSPTMPAKERGEALDSRRPVDGFFMQLYNLAKKKDPRHDPSNPQTCEKNREVLRSLGKALCVMEESVQAQAFEVALGRLLITGGTTTGRYKAAVAEDAAARAVRRIIRQARRYERSGAIQSHTHVDWSKKLHEERLKQLRKAADAAAKILNNPQIAHKNLSSSHLAPASVRHTPRGSGRPSTARDREEATQAGERAAADSLRRSKRQEDSMRKANPEMRKNFRQKSLRQAATAAVRAKDNHLRRSKQHTKANDNHLQRALRASQELDQDFSLCGSSMRSMSRSSIGSLQSMQRNDKENRKESRQSDQSRNSDQSRQSNQSRQLRQQEARQMDEDEREDEELLASNCFAPKQMTFTIESLKELLKEKIMNRTRSDEDRMRKVYRIFNEDGDGGIGPYEFHDGLRYSLGLQASKAVSDKLFRTIDTGGDGTLSIHELCQYLFPPKDDYTRKPWNVVAEERTLTKLTQEHALLNQRSGRSDSEVPAFHAGPAQAMSTDTLEKLLKEKIMNRTRSDEDRMRKVYRIFNEDGAGGIDADEFLMGLRYRVGLNTTKATADKLFNKMDGDGGGSLSIHELCQYLFPPKDDFKRETWVEKTERESLHKQQLQGLLQQQASRRGPPSNELNRRIRKLLAEETSRPSSA